MDLVGFVDIGMRFGKFCWLYIALAVILILRITALFIAIRNPDGGILIDSEYYLQLADTLSTTGRYAHASGQDRIWPPGYPAFLSVISGVMPGSLLPVVFVQLIISGMTALLLLEIGRCVKEPLAGISAGLLYAISPHGLFWSLTIMSETLFTFMLLLSLLLWTRYILSDHKRWLYICGGILGLSAWVRPIGLYLVLIWTVYMIVVFMKASGFKSALNRASALLIGAALVVMPWMVRNIVSYQRLEFAGVSSRTFYNFNLAQVIASGEGISRTEAALYIENETNLIRETFRVVIRYPKAFFQQQTAGIMRVSLGIESGVWAQLLGMGENQQRSFGIFGLLAQGKISQGLSRAWRLLVDSDSSGLLILGILSILYTLSLYLLAGAGIVLNRGSKSTTWVVVLIILTLGYLFLTPGAAGQARFRIPGEPLLAMLAGLGIVALRMRFVGSPNYAGDGVEIEGV